jgi:hypothetical protein
MWKPEKQREGDQALMEIVVKDGTFSASEMKELNRCRMYLQAFFVLDITDINGKYISPWARSGKDVWKGTVCGIGQSNEGQLNGQRGGN